MKAIEGNYHLELTSKECYEIAFWLYLSLLRTVETHWINNLQTDWKLHERERIEKMSMFFTFGLYPHLADHHIQQLDKIIIDAKESKK